MRVIILGVAIVAAGGAGYLAMNMVNQSPQDLIQQPLQAAAPKIETDEVLIADKTLSTGGRIGEEDLRWQEWPVEALASDFITKSARPDALIELQGQVIRAQIVPGEPVRPIKLLGADQSFMSSILPSGKRAVATNIAAVTSAGGFILPNDYVDVIMTRRGDAAAQPFVTETILRNIRVLAIDQTVRENEQGQLVIVGSTATLELTPRQSELIVVAQQMADRLTLALRSVQDVDPVESEFIAEHLLSGAGSNGAAGTVKMIKGGSTSSTATQAVQQEDN